MRQVFRLLALAALVSSHARRCLLSNRSPQAPSPVSFTIPKASLCQVRQWWRSTKKPRKAEPPSLAPPATSTSQRSLLDATHCA